MRLLVVAVLVAVALACEHGGKKYHDGEEWTEKNAFRMKCKIENQGAWRVLVTACISPDGMEIPINQTKAAGQFEWECKVSPEGQFSLKQVIGKTADCMGGHAHGTEWTDKSFRFRCEEGGRTQFVGCIASDGSLIPDGDSKAIGGFDIACKKHSNGTVTMGAVMKQDGSCRDSQGITRKNGETWIESEHFVKECKDNMPTVIGCKIPESETHVPLNGKSTQGKLDYFCEGNNGSFRFYSKLNNAPPAA